MSSSAGNSFPLPEGIDAAIEKDMRIRARFLVVELLIDMLWTDRLARFENPSGEAYSFKREVLGLIDDPEPEDDREEHLVHDLAMELLRRRLDAIVHRVDTTPALQSQAAAAAASTRRYRGFR